VGAFALGHLQGGRSEVATMELKALILVGAPVANRVPVEVMAGVPFACVDVLGTTVLERIAQQLKAAGIKRLALIRSADPEARSHTESSIHKAGFDSIAETGENFWQSAEEAFEQFRRSGTDLVLILNVGPYVELDYEEVIQHHINKRCRMTSVVAADGEALGTFVVDASRRGDATTLFRSGLQKVRDDCERFVAKGYVNLLHSASDFRRLAIDGLLERNAVRPIGKEVKPGIWVGHGAQIHRKARILAPAFIGARSKIRAASLITRNSVIEHDAEVDCGTVVENSTILPYTYVGAGLDVMHSVVGFRRISHLVREVDVEIHDEKLVGVSPANTLFRTLGSTAAFFVVLPRRVLRDLWAQVCKVRRVPLPESQAAPAKDLAVPDVNEPASGQEVGEFPANFAVVRRYGEH
jgi:NDP-sugar pyrophosphorylase family protein